MSDDGLMLGDAADTPVEDWGSPAAAPTDDSALYLELDGWEGPLDLLLDLARRQKVDLREISILALVDQYLVYIERAEALRLEIAADYLVMAAWLAYLKSALLLPKDEQEDPSPEELALRLQLRLQRLGAMREAAARLMARDRVGRDVFLRGAPEGLRVDRVNAWQCDWYQLVHAYGQVKARTEPVVHMVRERPVMTLDIGARPGFGDAWRGARLDGAARLPAASIQIRACSARRWLPASSPRSNWRGSGRLSCARKRCSGRST